MDILIRKAKTEDLNQIIELGNCAGEAFNTSENAERFWDKDVIFSCINNPDSILIVACDSDKIVGFILAGIVKSMSKLHLENIIVEKEYRINGIGTKLIDNLITHAQENKIKYICALTNIANNFFESVDFEKGEKFTWFNKIL